MEKIISLLIIIISLTGCSVIMSASKPTRPVTKERVLTLETRDHVESELTKDIIHEEKNEDGTLVTYSSWYDRGARVRIAVHTGLDVVTVGLWELVGAIGEANTNPTAYYDIEILYGENDEIKGVKVR